MPVVADGGQGVPLAENPTSGDFYLQHVTLRPTGTRALFASAGW